VGWISGTRVGVLILLRGCAAGVPDDCALTAGLGSIEQSPDVATPTDESQSAVVPSGSTTAIGTYAHR
jgi:hypothetical protein